MVRIVSGSVGRQLVRDCGSALTEGQFSFSFGRYYRGDEDALLVLKPLCILLSSDPDNSTKYL